jgi:putative hydrolase
MEQNVQAAIACGLEELAISDHGPGHLFYGIRRDDIPVMRRQLRALQKRYPEIRLYLSVEANIINNGDNNLDVSRQEADQFDFLIAGYHFGTRKSHMTGNWMAAHHAAGKRAKSRLYDENTEMNVRAVLENDLKIMTHPGDKGALDMAEVAKACARKGTWMEISTWHKHLTVEEIRICMREDVRFVISSDAHTPDRVGSYIGGLERAAEAGLDFDRIVNIRER